MAKFVKSNAIVYAKDNQTIGIGAGQIAVYSAKIAGIKAQDEGLTVAGCVMASVKRRNEKRRNFIICLPVTVGYLSG